MKQNSTQGTRERVPFKPYLVIFLTIFSLMICKSSLAHNVRYYNPPCFSQGQTTAIVVTPWIASSPTVTYYRWEYRIGSTGTWTLLNNGTNTINGHSITVANAYLPAPNANYDGTGMLLTLPLSITPSAGLTTQLDNIQLRILMKEGGDPGTHTGTIYGGEEFTNAFEAKYINLRSKPTNESCYANCTANSVVIIPSNPTLDTYYGGFEMGPYTSANFFTADATTGATNASTVLNQWTGGSSIDQYRILNNPDSMNAAFTAFAPHSGKTMMVVNANNSCTDRVWYRTIVVDPPVSPTFKNNYFIGNLNFKVWVAKLGTTTPAIQLQVWGGPSRTSAVTTQIIGTLTGTISATEGVWVQLTYFFSPLPQGVYKKFEFRIVNTNGCSGGGSFALDDLCIVDPQLSPVPMILSPLNGVYANGVSHLSWSTSQEINSSHFEIERSSDGVNYTFLARVNAKGNSDHQIDYSFNDIKVNDGTNFYRLKVVSLDGSFLYSNIIELNVSIKGTFITAIYPSPFSDKINISLSSETKDFATILLFDKVGRQLASQQATVNKGVNTITLNNLESLAKGFYIVKVQVGDHIVLTQKLIK